MLPAATIASPAIAGLAMRLVQRLDVRIEPTKASPAAASTAADGPCISSSSRMNTSPAANEFFECGMRTGKPPASIAISVPAATWTQTSGGWRATSTRAQRMMQAPPSTATHQYAVALRL